MAECTSDVSIPIPPEGGIPYPAYPYLVSGGVSIKNDVPSDLVSFDWIGFGLIGMPVTEGSDDTVIDNRIFQNSIETISIDIPSVALNLRSPFLRGFLDILTNTTGRDYYSQDS
jgi:hypothetical protein